MGKVLGIVEQHFLPASLAGLAPTTLGLLAGWALPKSRVNLTRFHGVFAHLCPLGATANTMRW
jgi:hypothetical protein